MIGRIRKKVRNWRFYPSWFQIGTGQSLVALNQAIGKWKQFSLLAVIFFSTLICTKDKIIELLIIIEFVIKLLH